MGQNCRLKQNVRMYKKKKIEKYGKLLRETRITQLTLVMGQSIVFLLSC